MAEATHYLVDLGHRHIGMIAGPVLQSDRARLRYEGYCQAMHERRLAPRPLIEMPQHTRTDVTVLDTYLQRPERLTALICTNDMLAISLMGDLQRAGYSVPRDMSVVGFDGIALGELLSPSLCSVVQPRAAIGQAAVNTLLDMIKGKSPPGERVLHALRQGASVGPPPPTPAVSLP